MQTRLQDSLHNVRLNNNVCINGMSAPCLRPIEALSQVVFIHDYFQLVFQDEGFNIYNSAEVVREGTSVRQGQPGFCDALVGLIGQRVISVTTTAPEMLLLGFERGARFRLLTGDEGIRGPEAFEFHGLNDLLVVEQNA